MTRVTGIQRPLDPVLLQVSRFGLAENQGQIPKARCARRAVPEFGARPRFPSQLQPTY